MSKLRSVVLLLVLCAVAMPQTRILLYDFEARGVDVSVTRANTQVLRDALNGTYKYVVVDPPVGTYCYNVLSAADSAKKYGAAQALIGNIMSVGGKQFLTYQLVDAGSSTLIVADKFDLPPMDQFPTMAERVAAAIVEKKPYMETIEPGKILETEAAGPWFQHPRKPYAGVLMTAGYLYHFVQRSPPDDFFATRLVNLNLAVSFETQHMLTMLQIGYIRGIQDERDISFDLFSHNVAGSGDFAPFYGGGIGITRFEWYDPPSEQRWSNDALLLSAGGGVLGLRTYYFRLIAAGYVNLAIAGHSWPPTPGVKVLFGVSSPSFGPDATIKTSPGCIGAAVGGVFLTGLIVMLTG